MTDIRVPTLGESVTEATIGKWFKQPGDAVAVDEPLVELGDRQGDDRGAGAGRRRPRPRSPPRTARPSAVGALLGVRSRKAPAPPPKPAPPSRRQHRPRRQARRSRRARAGCRSRRRTAAALPTLPLRRRCASSRPKAGSIRPRSPATGKDGRVTKGDMLAAIERAAAQPTPVRDRRRSAVRAPSPRRRCRARRARAHDAAAPDHRAAPQGCAEHRRHADDLQRGRHERGDGAAHPIQGPVREEARREARLHGLLRAGLRAGA